MKILWKGLKILGEKLSDIIKREATYRVEHVRSYNEEMKRLKYGGKQGKVTHGRSPEAARIRAINEARLDFKAEKVKKKRRSNEPPTVFDYKF